MRFADLDPNTWTRIAGDLNALCDELISDRDDDGEWPTGTVAADVYELVNRAAFLAALCIFNPGMTNEQRRSFTGFPETA